MVYNFSQENVYKYKCELCDFNSNNKYDYNKHLQTDKHNIKRNGISMVSNDINITQKTHFNCECGKVYQFKSGLYRHRKQGCKIEKKQENKENLDMKELVVKLITENKEIKNVMLKENQELRKQITEMIPLIGNNNNNTNNVKQKFNINIFLNEKCKDALTMNEFIDKIEISMKNLLITTNQGLGNGLTNIIMDNMNKLSLYERPIHCTDKKRETIYIKNDSWEKDEDNKQINNMIRKVENKQIRNLNKWIEANPNYMENEILKREFIKLTTNCASSIDNCKDKIVKNVCSEVFLEKEN